MSGSGRIEAAYVAWRRVTVVGAVLSGAAIFVMMCWILADVVSRNLLGGSIPGSFEVAQNYLMPAAVFPGLAYVYGSGILPRMDLLGHRFPAAVRSAVVHALLALEVVVLLVVLYYTWGYAIDGMEREVAFPAGGELYTLWPLYFMVPIGFAMVLVETLFVVARNVAAGPVALTMRQVDEVAEL